MTTLNVFQLGMAEGLRRAIATVLWETCDKTCGCNGRLVEELQKEVAEFARAGNGDTRAPQEVEGK